MDGTEEISKASSNRIAANRINGAQPRTSPTVATRERISVGRATHGLFAKSLVIKGERREDYDALLAALITDLNPVGAVEDYLVERIAMSIWRQRRLVRAESAALELQRDDRDSLARKLANQIGGDITENYLPDPEWVERVLSEAEALEGRVGVALDELPGLAPTVLEQLLYDADAECEDQEAIEGYLYTQGGFQKYLGELVRYAENARALKARYARADDIRGTILDGLLVLYGDKSETFAKYQAALDNATYKAIKSLKERQEWRLSTLEAEPSAVERSGNFHVIG